MKRELVKVNLNAALEPPTFWKIEGSMYRRNKLPSHMSEQMLQSLPDTFPEGGAYLLKQVEILRPGVYNGWEFTSLDMREIADLYNQLDPPPLQEDHSYSARDTHGRVIDVMLDDSIEGGPRVVGLVLFLGAYAVERVLDGRWSKFSGGIWMNPANLEHLAVTPFPACPTATMLSKNKNEENPMPEEEKNEGVSQEAPAESETPTPEPECTPDEQPQADLSAENEALKAELATLREQHAATERENLETKVRAELMGLVRSGHSSPDLHERELQFALSLSGEQRAAFIALRNSMEKIWEPGRMSQPVEKKPETMSANEKHAKASLMAAAGIKVKSDA